MILCGWLHECAAVWGGLEYRTEGCLINGARGPVVCSHAIFMLEMSKIDKETALVDVLC